MKTEEHEQELRRWQDAIRDRLIAVTGAPDSKIDGGGCDSGDPLDVTLTEMGQAVNWMKDHSQIGAAPCSAKYSDDNGNRWHRLSSLTLDGEPIEVMAASCMDWIGVIVRWKKDEGKWSAEALDTESCQWSPVDHNEEGCEIPAEPPVVWDDVSQNGALSNGGQAQ